MDIFIRNNIEHNGYWTFFNNPAKWDIKSFLDKNSKKKMKLQWKIAKTQVKYFEIGQLGVIRVGIDSRNKKDLNGKNKLQSGIYALVRVIKKPEFIEINDENYFDFFIDTEGLKKEKAYRVELEIVKNLIENPIIFSAVKDIPQLIKDKYLLPGIQKSTMPLSEEAYIKILELASLKESNIDNFDKLDYDGLDRDIIIKARIGQGYFKEKLMNLHGKCCLCGLKNKNFLVASHIKPWSQANTQEKLDEYNGLLLCPHHDSLFDRGYISFNNDGEIIISSKISEEDCMLLNINHRMKIKIQDKKTGNFPAFKSTISVKLSEFPLWSNFHHILFFPVYFS